MWLTRPRSSAAGAAGSRSPVASRAVSTSTPPAPRFERAVREILVASAARRLSGVNAGATLRALSRSASRSWMAAFSAASRAFSSAAPMPSLLLPPGGPHAPWLPDGEGAFAFRALRRESDAVFAQHALGFEQVVRAGRAGGRSPAILLAAEATACGDRTATSGVRRAMTVRAHERAASTVALPDRAANRLRDAAAVADRVFGLFALLRAELVFSRRSSKSSIAFA